MPEIRLAAEPQKFDPVALRLRHSRSDTYSQAGEDGIIAAIFEIMGTRNKWCAEFGAWDGVHLSNTCRLIREEGWSAVLIEGQEDRCGEIRQKAYHKATNLGLEGECTRFGEALEAYR